MVMRALRPRLLRIDNYEALGEQLNAILRRRPLSRVDGAPQPSRRPVCADQQY